MTFQELKDRCAVRFRDPDNIVVFDATWGDHVNAAYEEFTRQGPWPFLVNKEVITFTAGTRTHEVEATDSEGTVKGVYDATNDRRLVVIPPDIPPRDRALLANRVTTPFFYEWIGATLHILPAPSVNTTVHLWHFGDIVRLSAPTDTPLLPSRYHEVLVYGALATAHLDDQNPDFANLYRQEFGRIVQQAKQDLIEPVMEAQP